MKISICIGSSCHVKGSRQVVEQMKSLISDRGLNDKIELAGTFCMGKCQQGVCVMMDNEVYSVTPENTSEFFEEKVLSALK